MLQTHRWDYVACVCDPREMGDGERRVETGGRNRKGDPASETRWKERTRSQKLSPDTHEHTFTRTYTCMHAQTEWLKRKKLQELSQKQCTPVIPVLKKLGRKVLSSMPAWSPWPDAISKIKIKLKQNLKWVAYEWSWVISDCTSFLKTVTTYSGMGAGGFVGPGWAGPWALGPGSGCGSWVGGAAGPRVHLKTGKHWKEVGTYRKEIVWSKFLVFRTFFLPERKLYS